MGGRIMKLVEANQVPDGGKVSLNIWNLPCVVSASKMADGRVMFVIDIGGYRTEAYPTNWICRFDDGVWGVVPDNMLKTYEWASDNDYRKYYDETKPQCQTCIHCIYDMGIRQLKCSCRGHAMTEREKWLPRQCKDYERG